MPRLSARWGKENLVIISKQNKPANLLIPRRSTAAFPENIFLEKILIFFLLYWKNIVSLQCQ